MKHLIFLVLLFTISCSTSEHNNNIVAIEKENKQILQLEQSMIITGWSDNDTYTVTTTAENITKAKHKARFQILKDIVNVRMRNQSNYTDIEKISNEFDSLFKNAVIVKQKDLSDGVEIYFQIKEHGLKSKFERK